LFLNTLTILPFMISSIHEHILRMVGAFMDMSLLFVTVA